MSKPRLLDLFCGAGGAAMGYSRAGFDVVGVDIKPQPNYPFAFYKDNALLILGWLKRNGEVFGKQFDAIHTSPPCQAYTSLRRIHPDTIYPELIEPVRALLDDIGLPYVIENVVGAPLNDPIQLCGSSFGLRIRRHRLFELGGFSTALVPPCSHGWQDDKIFPALNHDDRKAGRRSGIVGVYGNGGDKRSDLWAQEMGIDWMSRKELTQAIPPTYTQYVGEQLITQLKAAA